MKCRVFDCDREAKIKGMCQKHYVMQWKYGRTNTIKNMHGLSESPEYRIYRRIKSRCTNPKTNDYHLYGGRGIKMCDEWSENFGRFYNYLGKRPSDKHSVDRIDANGNYEPGNVRWATPEEQSMNKRNSVKLTHNGTTMHITKWAEKSGIRASTIYTRIFNYGWTVSEAITVPVNRGIKRKDRLWKSKQD